MRKILNSISKKKTIDKSPKKLYPKDFSREDIELFEEVKPFTMTSSARIKSLIEATEYIVNNNIEGDFVECGTWKGGSAMVMAKTLIKKNDLRNIHIYDTFEGMPPPTQFDQDLTGRSAESRLNEEKNEKKSSWVWAYAELDNVKKNLAQTHYPKEKLHFIKGKVETTLLTNTPSRIALLRLDTDWYESTKIELEILYPLLVSGGILIIDDYGHWSGCKKAVDEFFVKQAQKIFLHRIDYTGRLVVKP